MQEEKKKSEVFQKSVSTEHTFIIWVKEGDSEVRSFYRPPKGLGGLPQFSASYLYQLVKVIMMYREAEQSMRWNME